MGYGLGASLGAKVGNPDKIVVNIAGDGCFRMNLNELATASRYNIPVIEVIINNSVLGMVRQWQDLFYEERYSYTTLQDKVDFVKVSEGLGVQAKKITDIEQFKDAFKEALNAGEPVVLDCHIDLDDKVWPMVNPGGSIEDAFDKSDLEAQARLIFNLFSYKGEKRNGKSIQLFSWTGSTSGRSVKRSSRGNA